ncbi:MULTISPECIES: bile acid:sodium symporter family protein [unclassified Dietzia]|uniref:bile acid:sodium symporter family protein n=1 Tax=unclassified Dietzia TaxID=2617939 RepID=UPI0015FBDBD3|nr:MULTISPECIES: bile acid:sodium symporter family protein [unclassified Dietzia]MBB1042082.1 bile acid:sodium symporter [Dietzia sp. Cai40]MBB1046182.1 bile acid:sodium symporter [Dietzia sp. DQ11-44]MBB1049795.1 bile acid:sodium symporter [Dietzia sp. CW19]
MSFLRRLRIEPFILAILAAVVVAAVLPATGGAATALGWVTTVGIAVLFFLYGARLEPRELLAGVKHWRLHSVVLAATFLLFPAFGLLGRWALTPVLGEALATGFLFLTLVPSTVQSSITFVAIARGHVSAAVVSASVSNLLGVFVTPLLVFALMTTDGSVVITWDSVGAIALQLLLPFVLGQLLRRWVLPVTQRIKRLALFDKSVIVLIVYSAFSDGVADGIWSMVGPAQLTWLIVACCVLLGVVLGLTELISRALGFEERDKRVVQFCGSKKSLATGLPMAAVLFVGQPVGLLVLPLMVFHQIQLIVCAWLAGRYGREQDAAAE